MFSAFIRTEEEFAAFEKEGIPWSQIMAYVGPLNKPENRVLYEKLHQRGVKVMISTAPTYDKLEKVDERRKAYRDVIAGGADVIESDLPIEVAEALASESDQKWSNKRDFGFKP